MIFKESELGYAKGVIPVSDGSGYRHLMVGTDTYVLTCDSTQPYGVKWGAAGGSGGGDLTAGYIIATTDNNLQNAQVLASLATGLLKNTTTTGVLSIAEAADLPAMTASGTGHHGGAVPDPGASAGTTHFLREDATWAVPPAGAGGASTADNFIVQTAAGSSDLTNAFALGTLSTGLLKVTQTTGVMSTATGADVPSTGLAINQCTSIITTGEYASPTTTLNLATSNWHSVTLTASVTLALSGVSSNQQFTIVLIQGSGGQTVTWFTTIKWAGGSPPTLSTGSGAIDVFTFKQTSAGNYYGFVAGQALA